MGLRLTPGDPQPCTGCQYADDTEVVLGSEAAVAPFLQAMDAFARASGQRLNLDKVELLRVGAIPAAAGQQQPAAQEVGQLEGLKVVTTATALNLPMSNSTTSPQPDWQRLTSSARSRLQFLAQCPMSAIGRGLTASAYALQTVTWHMEHGGWPPAGVLDELERWVARLVDRRQGPGDRGQRLTGVPRGLLAGRAEAGGFGVLPLRAHIAARFAAWAARFVVWGTLSETDHQPPCWVRVLAALLRLHHPALEP